MASGLVLLVSLWPEVAPGISRHAKLVAIAAAETAVAVVFTVSAVQAAPKNAGLYIVARQIIK